MRGLLRVLGGSAVAPPYEKMKQPRVQPHGLAGRNGGLCRLPHDNVDARARYLTAGGYAVPYALP